MTGIKRVPDVLLTFQRLLAQGVDATLVLVGDGPERVHLEEQARDLGIARNTLFVGYQRDIAPYFELFDALLLPSGNEGTPVVAIEALDALAASLERLAKDPALRASFGTAGREHVIPRYRVSRLLDDVDALYRELLSELQRP
jgi:glycosyltransferase involved in cell wall biosynthesis